jgi:hypothetical protein
MGEFKGVYHLDGSDRVVVTVDTGGVVLPSGVVASSGGGDKIEIDGSSVEGTRDHHQRQTPGAVTAPSL